MIRGDLDYLHPINTNHPLARDIVGCWMVPPNLRGGSTLFNLAGPISGSLVNATIERRSADGIFGSVATSNASSDQGVILDAPFGPHFTFITRFYVPSAFASSSSDRVGLITNNTGSGGTTFGVTFTATPALYFLIDNGPAAPVHVTGATTLSTKTWYWVAAVLGPADNMSVYLNGELDGSGTAFRTTGLSPNTNRLFGPTSGAIGCQVANQDGVFLINRPLGAGEIREFYREQKLGYPTLLNRIPRRKSATPPPSFSITFDADGTIGANIVDSDTDSAYYDDCNDAPDGSSADYVANDLNETSTTCWLRLADVPTDFSSLDSLSVTVDVDSTGFSNDTCTLTARIYDADNDTTNPLTAESGNLATDADSTRTQRTVNFSSLTGTKTQWNAAYCRLTWTYTKNAGPDNAQVRIYGAQFDGTYTAAAGTFTASAGPTIGAATAAASATFSAGTHTATADPTSGPVAAAASSTFTPPVYTATADPSMGPATAVVSATFSPGTHTATADPITGAVTSAASATFSPGTHTATVSANQGASTAAVSATFSPGTHTATASPSVGASTASATATFATATFTATVSADVGAATGSASSTFTAPVYTASAAPSIGGVTAAASATFATVTFTASVSASTGGATGSVSATFDSGTFTASVPASVGAASASVSVSFTPPSFTASLAPSIGPTTAVSSATFSSGTFTGTASASIGPTTGIVSSTFTPLTFTSTITATCAAAISAAAAEFFAKTLYGGKWIAGESYIPGFCEGSRITLGFCAGEVFSEGFQSGGK